MLRWILLVGLVSACGASADPEGEGENPGGDPDAGEEGGRADSGPDVDPGPAFSEVALATTHNSYSGGQGGDRGTIREQLELGVRVLEFDIHDNDFLIEGYRLGHNTPGNEVDHDGSNPDGNRLEDWLAVVKNFSQENPGHAPIVINLDAKDDLTDNEDWARGEMGMLAATVEGVFGDSLVRAEDIGSEWPGVETLRGKVMAVVSGDHGTRLRYRRADGRRPSIAVNLSGQVMLVHDDDSGNLFAWTGVIEGNAIQWKYRSRYDTGTDPAIVLSDEGVVVEVHEDPDGGDDKLWYRVGQLSASGELSWSQEQGRTFPNEDKGVDPSLAFVGGGLQLREIHLSQSSGNAFYWNGTVDLQQGIVVWSRDGDNGSTTDARFDETSSGALDLQAKVTLGAIASYGADTLRVAVNGGDPQVVRYPQILFVDAQPGSSAQLRNDPGVHFFAASASDSSARTWAGEQRAAGGVVRLFNFDDPSQSSSPTENHGATDHPFEAWYKSYCEERGCLDW